MYFPSVSCVRFTTSDRISSLISDYTTKHISRHNLKSTYSRLESNLATKHSYDILCRVLSIQRAITSLASEKIGDKHKNVFGINSGLGSSERTHCGRAFQDA